MSWAAPLSSEQARMALPILDLLVKVVRAIMMTMQEAMVTRVITEMESCPSKRVMRLPVGTMGLNTLGLEDHSSRAAFWRK